MSFKPFINKLILQPTPLCNLNCRYCYLSERSSNKKMLVRVADQIAMDIEKSDQEIAIIWHGGEPLSVGHENFLQLLQPFRKLTCSGQITHFIQTNATLIDDKWCQIFSDYEFRIGVSIDGPVTANHDRVDWANSPSFHRALSGINKLKSLGTEFYALAVISNASLKKAKEIYQFFCELGCHSLGINIEEIEGINKKSSISDEGEVERFWKDLFLEWKLNPAIRVREFSQALSWMMDICTENPQQHIFESRVDILPTISWNGNVVVLSPEFLGTKSLLYKDFIVGNVLYQSLWDIIKNAESAQYFIDFINGVHKCGETCDYFSFCRGGHAGNKFFELGKTDGTETSACRNSKQRLVDAILQTL